MARKIEIDGNSIGCREDLFASLREQLASEDFIGSNLDALYDVLTESPEPIEVEFRDMGKLRAALGGYTDRLLRVLMDCQAVCGGEPDEHVGQNGGASMRGVPQNGRPGEPGVQSNGSDEHVGQNGGASMHDAPQNGRPGETGAQSSGSDEHSGQNGGASMYGVPQNGEPGEPGAQK